MGTTAAVSRRSRRLHAFGSLAGNRALLRVLAAYLVFTLAEYAVWIAMLVFAYGRGGTATAGLVAVAQLALKVWMTVHTFGLNAFRACIQRNLELADYAEGLLRSHPQLTLMAPATLGIVCFRREWPGCDEAETERLQNR